MLYIELFAIIVLLLFTYVSVYFGMYFLKEGINMITLFGLLVSIFGVMLGMFWIYAIITSDIETATIQLLTAEI